MLSMVLLPFISCFSTSSFNFINIQYIFYIHSLGKQWSSNLELLPSFLSYAMDILLANNFFFLVFFLSNSTTLLFVWPVLLFLLLNLFISSFLFLFLSVSQWHRIILLLFFSFYTYLSVANNIFLLSIYLSLDIYLLYISFAHCFNMFPHKHHTTWIFFKCLLLSVNIFY